MPTRDDLHSVFTDQVLPEIEVLLRVARSITPQPADAEDLVQETLLRAYRSIGGFDGRHPRAWLLTILRNTAINLNRRQRPGLLDDPDLTWERVAAMPGWASSSPEEIIVEREFDTAVGAAFATLPDKYQQVVRLVDTEGYSYDEAAHRLGIPSGTAMSRLHRARTRIRKQVTAAGVAPAIPSRQTWTKYRTGNRMGNRPGRHSREEGAR